MVSFNFFMLILLLILKVIICIFLFWSGVDVFLRLIVLEGFVCFLFVSSIVILGMFFCVCGKSCEVVNFRVWFIYVMFFLCGSWLIVLIKFFVVRYWLKWVLIEVLLLYNMIFVWVLEGEILKVLVMCWMNILIFV